MIPYKIDVLLRANWWCVCLCNDVVFGKKPHIFIKPGACIYCGLVLPLHSLGIFATQGYTQCGVAGYIYIYIYIYP